MREQLEDFFNGQGLRVAKELTQEQAKGYKERAYQLLCQGNKDEVLQRAHLESVKAQILDQLWDSIQKKYGVLKEDE